MKARTLVILAGCGALCACASPQIAANAPSADLAGVDVAAVVAGNGADYVMKAGASDLFEIESSRIALTRARDADVRAYAQMMIDHHTRTSAQVMEAARADGLNPPAPILPADKMRKLDALRTVSAETFDQAYVREQLTGHTEALVLHQNFAEEGRVEALKRVAGAAVPIVRSHLDRAHVLARDVG